MSHAVLSDAILGTGESVLQILNTALAPNNTIEAGYESAGLDPVALFLKDANPQIRLTSSDIAGVLALVSPTAGLDIDDDLWTIPYRHRAAGGTFAGATSHTIFTGANAFVVPQSLSSQQGNQDATIDLLAMLESADGIASPMTVTGSQTIAAVSSNAFYGHGPAAVNGTAIVGSVRHTVNFGIAAAPFDKGDGQIFPTAHSIRRRMPTIEIEFLSPAQLATYASLFAAMTSCTVYFRKRTAGGAYVADATEEHVSCSFTDGIIDVSAVSASGEQTARPTLRLVGESLTVSTTAALP